MKKIPVAAILILILLLGAACSPAASKTDSTPTPTRTPTPTITPTPTPSPAQILFKAGAAMLDMESARFTLLRDGAPIVLDAATGMSFTQAAGEYQAPDRVHATVKVGLMGTVLEIQIYWLPEGVFILNPLTQQFETASMDLGIDGAAIFKADGMPAVLATGIENPERVGFEDIEGVATIHISGESDGATLAPLTAGALKGGTLYPVDVWVDRSTFVPVRVHVTEPDGSGWLIDLYDIDTEIEVDLP
ncbi:MAG: LppX_LprAFG lipoprotein [Anaerolineales bacterium]|nr:LppX_LprAFG lipoprotein [Anaerolineales bacterium]